MITGHLKIATFLKHRRHAFPSVCSPSVDRKKLVGLVAFAIHLDVWDLADETDGIFFLSCICACEGGSAINALLEDVIAVTIDVILRGYSAMARRLDGDRFTGICDFPFHFKDVCFSTFTTVRPIAVAVGVCCFTLICTLA